MDKEGKEGVKIISAMEGKGWGSREGGRGAVSASCNGGKDRVYIMS